MSSLRATLQPTTSRFGLLWSFAIVRAVYDKERSESTYGNDHDSNGSFGL